MLQEFKVALISNDPKTSHDLNNIIQKQFTRITGKKLNLKIIVRGLRAVSDFDFEFQRALLNRKNNNVLLAGSSIMSVRVMHIIQATIFRARVALPTSITQDGATVNAMQWKQTSASVKMRLVISKQKSTFSVNPDSL